MKQTFRDLSSIMGRLGEFRRLFIGSVLVIALHQIALILVSVVSVWITTRLVSEDHPRLLIPFLALFCLAIAHALGYLYDAWWSHQLAYQILARMRIDLYAAIQRIAPRGLSGRRTGDLTAAAMNDMEQLEWFYAHTAPWPSRPSSTRSSSSPSSSSSSDRWPCSSSSRRSCRSSCPGSSPPCSAGRGRGCARACPP